MRKFLTLAALVVLIIPVLAACGPATPPPPEKVRITLTEFEVTSSLTTFQVGQPYEFTITNTGTVAHEFTIMRPLSAEEAADTEHMMSDALVMVTQEELAPGDVVTVEYTFTEEYPAGKIEISCHTPGHYQAGMKLAITVSK
jgi:uncharacterized cupredoxin-like copper-binding protein